MRAVAYKYEPGDGNESVTFLCFERRVYVQRKFSIYDTHFIWTEASATSCDGSCQVPGSSAHLQDVDEEGQCKIREFLEQNSLAYVRLA